MPRFAQSRTTCGKSLGSSTPTPIARRALATRLSPRIVSHVKAEYSQHRVAGSAETLRMSY